MICFREHQKITMFRDSRRKTTIFINMILFTLLLGNLEPLAGKCSCEKPWLPFLEHCYLFVDKRLNQTDAESTCQSLSDYSRACHLVSILSQVEQDFIAEGVWKHFGNRRATIGLKRVTGVFTWLDGSEMGYSAWQPGQPGTTAVCAATRRDTILWGDVNCQVKRRFICKK